VLKRIRKIDTRSKRVKIFEAQKERKKEKRKERKKEIN